MSSQEYIRSITEIIPDDFPTLTPLPETSGPSSSSSSSFMGFLFNITWQTWIIIILILALLGINVFAYLAKGTQETVSIFEQIFGPILKFFGYSTLETSKQTIETSATGTKAGVDIIAGATTGAIDTIQQTALSNNNTNNNSVIPQGQMASSTMPVQSNIQEAGANMEQWQQDSLVRALDNAKQTPEINPDDSRSSIQTMGKSGWCYIGEEQGMRTCSEIGVNDICMSGDVFPTQAVCMNPSLRA